MTQPQEHQKIMQIDTLLVEIEARDRAAAVAKEETEQLQLRYEYIIRHRDRLLKQIAELNNSEEKMEAVIAEQADRIQELGEVEEARVERITELTKQLVHEKSCSAATNAALRVALAERDTLREQMRSETIRGLLATISDTVAAIDAIYAPSPHTFKAPGL
jgi:chromosome segregation ATPase